MTDERAPSTNAVVPTLHLLSGGAAKGVVGAMQADFTAATGACIEGTFGAVGAMQDRLFAGAPCDVVILTAALIERLVAEGHVVDGSSAPLGRVPTGIAVRHGDPRPDVSDRVALTTALRAAPAIYFPDPRRATAGIHFMRVLERLGIEKDVAHALKPYPNGAVAMATLATDGVAGAIGCTQVTEILYTDGVTLVGPLPTGFELATVYMAGVCRRTANPPLAARLVALLTGPDSADVRARGGFEF